MSYLDRSKEQYTEVINLIDKKLSEGKGIKSLRKSLVKRVKEIEYLMKFK